MWRSWRLQDAFIMLLFLDHPGFIERSLRGTQYNGQTDVVKWSTFWETFQKDVENITLLATVLLTANVGFLAIQTVDSPNGLHSWPQRLSYMSPCCIRQHLDGIDCQDTKTLYSLQHSLLPSDDIGSRVSI